MAGFLTSFWDRCKELAEIVDGVGTTVIVFNDEEVADEAFKYAQDEEKFYDAVPEKAEVLLCRNVVVVLWPLQ